MEPFSFWESRWVNGRTGWHLSEIHPFLIKHSSNIDFSCPKRVLVPLCGKCLELIWFYEKGLEVVGVELIEAPVQEYFKEHNLPFEIEELSWAKIYQTTDKRLKIYVASFYDINFDDIGKFDLIWDRGSQTAIEYADRDRYSKVIKGVCKEKFVYLLSTLQFDESGETVDQPPRPMSHEETRKMFGDWCNIEIILQEDVTDDRFRRRGINEVLESYILLTPKG